MNGAEIVRDMFSRLEASYQGNDEVFRTAKVQDAEVRLDRALASGDVVAVCEQADAYEAAFRAAEAKLGSLPERDVFEL